MDEVNAALGRRGCGAGAEEFPGDGVVERVEGGVDDVGGDADGGPALALAIGALEHHPRHSLGAVIGGQDADLEIDQPHILQRRVEGSSALRSAVSSAFTGPLPVATVISRSSPTSTVMVASDSVTSSPRAFQRRSSMTRKRARRKNSGT